MHCLQTFRKLTQSFAILFSLFFSFFSLISFSSLFAVTIPSEYGRVQESTPGANGKTIVLIQEAHVNYGAQKSIAEILRFLIEQHGLKHILVEGGWGDVSLSYLRKDGSPKGRIEVADRYLLAGKISGEEYLDIASDLDMKLWGIEDPVLYEENMKAFLSLHKEQPKLTREIEGLHAALKAIQEKILPPSVLEFEKKKRSFETGKLSMLEYLEFVSKQFKDTLPSSGKKRGQVLKPVPFFKTLLALASGEDLFETYPNLKHFLALTGDGGALAHEKMEVEKRELIRLLSRIITKPELSTLELLQDRKNPEDEIRFLKTLLQKIAEYPEIAKRPEAVHLQQYAEALQALDSSDSGRIFTEMEKLETDFLKRSKLKPEARELLDISRAVSLLEKLFTLQMSPSDLEKISRMNLKPTEWKKILGKANLRPSTFDPQPALSYLESWIPGAKGFYDAARQREKALLQNTVDKLKTENPQIAALIIGGFHAEELKRDLAHEGYGVLVVSPRFMIKDTSAESQHYFEILKYKWNSRLARDYSSALPQPQQGGLTAHGVQQQN